MAIEKKKRNCFISYHHDYDQEYLEELREVITNMRVADYSLKDDIGHLTDETIYKKVREKMRNCSVTVVLVGSKTGHRKWIDWEIWASLRSYTHPTNKLKSFYPNGLLVIFLPTETHSIPNRLNDNIKSGFAVSMRWKNLQKDFESKVNYAYWKRFNHNDKIDNTRERQTRNYMNVLGLKI